MKDNDSFSFDNCSDEELVFLAQKGDNTAFDVLAKRFLKRRPKTVSAGYLDGDDLSQESMLGFLSAVRTYSDVKNVPFSAYALICMNNRVASAARKTANDLPVDSEANPADVAVETENPIDSIVERENYSSVLSLCENVLSDSEKSVIFCRMSGLSYSEIADKLGMTPKTVDNALQRARRKLKDVFA